VTAPGRCPAFLRIPSASTCFPVTKLEFYLLLDTILELPPGTIKGDEPLATLEGWDSLAVVGFIATVDKHLKFVVPPKPLVAATSVPDLTALVADKLTG